MCQHVFTILAYCSSWVRDPVRECAKQKTKNENNVDDDDEDNIWVNDIIVESSSEILALDKIMT